MLFRVAGMVATTPAGLAARALAIGRNDPGFDFAYDGADSLAARILLAPLLRDGHALATGTLPPDPDATLIPTVPEFEWLLAAYETPDLSDEERSKAGEAFDAFCVRVARMPAAATQAGRASQAHFIMRRLVYVADFSNADTSNTGELKF